MARGETWEVARDGVGGFLNPPGHPEHTWGVVGRRGRNHEEFAAMSLTYAISDAGVPEAVRQEARELLASWQPGAAPDAEWVAHVLGYFRSCYRGPAVPREWHAGELRIDAKRDPLEAPEEHAGVLLIRKYYPAWTPTAEDFARARWGKD